MIKRETSRLTIERMVKDLMQHINFNAEIDNETVVSYKDLFLIVRHIEGKKFENILTMTRPEFTLDYSGVEGYKLTIRGCKSNGDKYDGIEIITKRC